MLLYLIFSLVLAEIDGKGMVNFADWASHNDKTSGGMKLLHFELLGASKGSDML
jgi:hypothetical protein